MPWSRENHTAMGVALVVTAGLLLAACGGHESRPAAASSGCRTVSSHLAASTAPAPGSWPYANGDLANTRYATGSTISSGNVSRLVEAWRFKLTGKAAAGAPPWGALTANPIS